jgi:hypothetical protein
MKKNKKQETMEFDVQKKNGADDRI